MPEITHHADPFGASDPVITCDERDPAAGGGSHHYEIRSGDKVIATVDLQRGPHSPDCKLTGRVTAALDAALADLGPVPEVLDTIEQLLDKARSGDVRAVAVVTLGADGRTSTAWSAYGRRDRALLGFGACQLAASMTARNHDPLE
jgi:hypothetical protein